jgi:DNA-binding transcriptional regulator PaaX
MPYTGLRRDDELEAFVKRYLVSFAAWDLLVLLNAQPDLRESLARLAYRLGRSERDVREAAVPMVEGGLLEKHADDDSGTYNLTSELGERELLERFVAASEDREWRLDLVRQVLNRLV